MDVSVTGIIDQKTYLENLGGTSAPLSPPGSSYEVETFKYRGVVFTSDESRNKGFDIRICKANAVLRELHCSVMTKQELSKSANLSVLKSVFVPILTYGH